MALTRPPVKYFGHSFVLCARIEAFGGQEQCHIVSGLDIVGAELMLVGTCMNT